MRGDCSSYGGVCTLKPYGKANGFWKSSHSFKGIKDLATGGFIHSISISYEVTMCWAYCQAHKLGRGQVHCGNSHQAGVYGMTRGCTQSGDYDTGKRNGKPKRIGDMEMKWLGIDARRLQKRRNHWLSVRGTDSHSYKDVSRHLALSRHPSLPWTSWRDMRVSRNQAEPPELSPKPKGKWRKENHPKKTLLQEMATLNHSLFNRWKGRNHLFRVKLCKKFFSTRYQCSCSLLSNRGLWLCEETICVSECDSPGALKVRALRIVSLDQMLRNVIFRRLPTVFYMDVQLWVGSPKICGSDSHY